MSQVSYHQRYAWIGASDALNIDNAAGEYEWVGVGVPCEVMRVGMTAVTAIANAASTVTVTIKHRPTVGATTSQALVDTWQVMATTALAAGTGSYRDMIRETAAVTEVDDSTYNVGPSGGIIVLPGESLFFEVGNASDSGVGYLWIEYLVHPFAGTTNINSFTKDTT